MSCAYQLNNLRFAYGKKTVLTLPALTVCSGKITAIIGPNGCGKSTLLNLLAFMERPSAVELCFFGAPVKP
jgi:tungstate transport system ATP-binding protein